MASQNPIHTLSTPNPVERPRAKPLATTARSAGYGRSRGLSDHSGRQGTIISITPSVAHKNTNRSTPIRRIHTRIDEGEGRETESCKDMSGANVSVGGFRFPTSSESVANGSLGSEIIARKSV